MRSRLGILLLVVFVAAPSLFGRTVAPSQKSDGQTVAATSATPGNVTADAWPRVSTNQKRISSLDVCDPTCVGPGVTCGQSGVECVLGVRRTGCKLVPNGDGCICNWCTP